MTPPAPGGRALFVRAGVIGDLVVTLPVLAAWLEAGPVDVVCGARPGTLLPLLPGADRIGDVWDIGGAGVGWLFGAGAAPRRWERAAAFSPGVAEALRALGIPEVIAASPTPRGPAAAHFAVAFGVGDAVPRLRVAAPPPGRLLLAPGASDPARSGDPAWWRAVAAALVDLPCTWVLGPSEIDAPGPGPVLRPDLPETARIAARSVWIGADSGPGHVAAAAGARVGVAFVASDPAVWTPPGATAFRAGSTPAEVARWARAVWKSTVQHDIAGASG